LAATICSFGTRFGSEAWRLGRNKAPKVPRQNATTYRWARVGGPPTNSDATAAARNRSAPIMSFLRESRSTSGPPTAPITAEGPSWRMNSSANAWGDPCCRLRLVATASV